MFLYNNNYQLNNTSQILTVITNVKKLEKETCNIVITFVIYLNSDTTKAQQTNNLFIGTYIFLIKKLKI